MFRTIFVCLSFALLTISSMATNETQAFTITIASQNSPSQQASSSIYPNTKSSQAEDGTLTSRYYDTVARKVVLDDGRIVTCRIPLIAMEEEKAPLSHKGNLTQQEFQSALVHFKDTCVRHRTKDFLWEFCHGKYLRQYDDAMTVQAANKPEYELFFLGFFDPAQASKFQKEIRADSGDYNPKREYFEKETRFLIPGDLYVKTVGNLARTSNFTVNAGWNNKQEDIFVLIVYVPASKLTNHSIVINPLGETLGEYMKNNTKDKITKRINGESFIILERLIRTIVGPSVFLLEDEFPLDLTAKQFDIRPYHGRSSLGKRGFTHTESFLDGPRVYSLYKNYLYGSPSFWTTGSNVTTVFLIFNDTHVEGRSIVSTLEDTVVLLDKGVNATSAKLRQVLFIPDSLTILQNVQWTLRRKQVLFIGNVVITKNAAFTKEFKRGDVIMLFDLSNVLGKPFVTREILKVVNDNILVLRTAVVPLPHIKNNFFPSYFIGKASNTTKELAKIRQQRMKVKQYKDQSLNHTNTDLTNLISFLGKGKGPSVIEIFSTPNQQFLNPESWMLFFNLELETTDANLLINFGKGQGNPEGIELNFYRMEKIIVTNYGEKASFISVPISQNQLIDIAGKAKIWVLFHKGVLRVGIGKEISLANQLIAFKSEKYKSLSHFTFNRLFTYSLLLYGIQVSHIPEETFKTLEIMDEIPRFEESVSYFESYTNGTLCKAAGRERSVEVEYKCSKNGEFMKIEEINEKQICRYHLIVGSNLLCPESEKVLHKYGDISSQINCVV